MGTIVISYNIPYPPLFHTPLFMLIFVIIWGYDYKALLSLALSMLFCQYFIPLFIPYPLCVSIYVINYGYNKKTTKKGGENPSLKINYIFISVLVSYIELALISNVIPQ